MRPAAQARDLMQARWVRKFGQEAPWPALRILLAQTRQEGQWGQFGGYDGEGNWIDENWGGVQYPASPPCPFGSFAWHDSKPTSQGQLTFQQCFQGYLSAADGIDDFLHHAIDLRPNAKAPLLAGDAWGYAKVLRRGRYYFGFSTTLGEGPDRDALREWEQIGSYVDMLDAQGREVDRAFGLVSPPPTHKPAAPRLGVNPGASARGGGLFWLAALAAGAILISRK